MSLRLADRGIDLMSLAAHKFRGPKGVGVLYVRRGVPFLTQQSGGGQERQRRAGTENVAGIVGAAEALRLTQENLETDRQRVGALSYDLRSNILQTIPGAAVNGHPERRLANNVSISFEGADAQDLVRDLDTHGIACSAGAACAGTNVEPSHVLLALGVSLERAVSTLRFSLGHTTTNADIAALMEVLPAAVERSRAGKLVGAAR
jgi:cysteine desulfurase